MSETANNKKYISRHILPTSTNLLGLCFVFLSGIRVLKLGNDTIIDELAAIAILFFLLSGTLREEYELANGKERSCWLKVNGSVFKIMVFLLTCCFVAVGIEVSAKENIKPPSVWRFVSIPDFLNNDVAYPEPKWDQALDYVLGAIKEENPDFVVVAGDLVMGHWSKNKKDIQNKARVYYPAWIKRMQAYGLNFYAAVGDHELGDDPWEGKKKLLVHFYEKAFRKYLQMPGNGPEHMKGLAFSVLHENMLIIVVDVFEKDTNGDVTIGVSGEQLAWVKKTLEKNKDVKHVAVIGHVPILPGWKTRSSSQLSIKSGSKSELWQTFEKYGVDLYLCGEVHDISIQRKGNVHQIVHGSQPSHVPEFNYLLVTVFPDRMELELKQIDTILEGDQGGGYKYANRIVRISKEKKKEGFVTVGKMTIRKHGKQKQFEYKEGVFKNRFSNLDENPKL